MANIRQQHPTQGSSFSIKSSLVGISINQNDFMRLYPGFIFQIDYGDTTEEIQLGRTGVYEIDKPITADIVFPSAEENEIFPQSLLLDIFELD